VERKKWKKEGPLSCSSLKKKENRKRKKKKKTDDHRSSPLYLAEGKEMVERKGGGGRNPGGLLFLSLCMKRGKENSKKGKRHTYRDKVAD